MSAMQEPAETSVVITSIQPVRRFPADGCLASGRRGWRSLCWRSPWHGGMAAAWRRLPCRRSPRLRAPVWVSPLRHRRPQLTRYGSVVEGKSAPIVGLIESRNGKGDRDEAHSCHRRG